MEQHTLKRRAQDASACSPSWQPSRKRRAVDDGVASRPAPIIANVPASPRAKAVDNQQSTHVPLPPPFVRPSSPPSATATVPPAPPALLTLPSNCLLQAYDPLLIRVRHHSYTPATRIRRLTAAHSVTHVEAVVSCSASQTQHLPYVPLRVAHVHSTAITHHDQPIYLSKLQDSNARRLRSQLRTLHTTQQPPRTPLYGPLTSATDTDNGQWQSRSRQPQADGGEVVLSSAERTLLPSASSSPFKRRTSAERTVASRLGQLPSVLPPELTVEPQQSTASDDGSPPPVLSPSFSSQSSMLPAVGTPPHTASQQRRSNSLFSLSLSSSSSCSSSTGSLAPPVSRSLSFQLQSSSSFTTAPSFSLSLSSTAATFDAMLDYVPLPADECEPLLLITPPPLISKKSASHLRMANRSQPPLLTCQPLTPSKDERHSEAVDGDNGDKENMAPVSGRRQQHTPRSHKDLFAVKSATPHSVSVSGSRRRGVEETRMDSGWHNEERASAMRRLRSMR